MRILLIAFMLALHSVTGYARGVEEMDPNTIPALDDKIYSVDVSDHTERSTGTGKSLTIPALLKAGNIYIDGVNVGIGTFSTAEKLFVQGTVQATAFIGDGSGLQDVPSPASDQAYSIDWDGDVTGVASKNALYDKIEEIVSGTVGISDDPYGVGWDGDGALAPSRNAVYDKIESLVLDPVGVSDDAFGAGWDGVTDTAPSQNAVYDKFQSLSSGSVSDTVYGPSWNGDSSVAPSKNAVYDKIESISIGGGTGPDNYTAGLSYSMISQSSFNQENQNTAHSNNLKTYNGNQYICYIEADRKLTLGKRPSGGTWTTYKYDGTGGRPNITNFEVDNHNTCNIGIDDEGFIHVAYNMHADPLRYRRSTSAEDVSNLGSEISMVGTNESFVTYPNFFNDTSGALWLIFRDGVSGNGDEYMYKYTSDTTTWSAAPGTSTGGKFMDGKSTQISAYFNVPIVDSANVAHMAFIWRDGASPDTSFDIGYVKYDITSGAFLKYTGAAQTIPMTSTNDTPAATIAADTGLANATSKHGIALDSNNYPYITYYKNDANGNTNYYVTAFNGTTWSTHGPISRSTEPDVTQDPIAGLNNSMVLSTPTIIIDADDNVYIIGRNNELAQGLLVWKSTTDDLDNWNEFSIFNGSIGKMLISFDNGYWKSSGKVNFIIAPVLGYRNVATQTGTNTPNIGILEWIPATGEHTHAVNYNRIMTDDDIEFVSTAGDVNVTGLNFSSNNQVFRYAGNVGIGTMTAPSGTVEIVKRGTDVPFMISSTAASDGNYLTVTSSGNVGIGTWNPTQLLDVNGNLKVRSLTSGQCVQASTNGLLTTTGSACGSGGGGVGIGTVNPGSAGYIAYYPSSGTSLDDLSPMYSDGTNIGLGTTNTSTRLYVNGTVTATNYLGDGSGLTGISGGGSIGIGTANTITFWPTTTTIGSLPTGTYPSLTELSYVKGATSSLQTQINSLSVGSGGWTDGGTNIYPSTTTDNVGIGTTTPNAATLEVVKNAGQPLFKVSSTVTGNGDYMVITSAGSMGIGTSGPTGVITGAASSSTAYSTSGTPAARISVLNLDTTIQNYQGFLFRTRDSAGAIATVADISAVNSSHTSSSVTGDLVFKTSSSGTVGERMRIVASGNTGIGTLAPASLLDVKRKFNVLTGGNVGVGTWLPTNTLQVVGTVSATTFSGAGTSLTGTAASLTAGNVTTNANLTGDVTSSGNATTLSSTYKGWTDGGTNIYPTLTSDQVAIGTTTPISGASLTVLGTLAGAGTGPIAFTNANVGIGTTTAGALLTVGSTGQATIDSSGIIQPAGYKSADGTTGATVTTCTGFKNGLCISGT